MFCVHGSLGNGDYREGWSDVDIIISTSGATCNHIEQYFAHFPQFEIKVGITFYDDSEINNLNVDAKTLYVIYAIIHGRLSVQHLVPHLLSGVSLSAIKEKNDKVLPEAIHSLKRMIFSKKISDIDIKQVIKKLNMVMKVMLINNHNIFPISYENVAFNFAYVYGIEPFNISQAILDMDGNREYIVTYAHQVLEIYWQQGNRRDV